MNRILAGDKENGIDCNNQLLFRIPEDMKYFRSMTLGKVVVMGHETFKSLPKAQPLVDRVNIVLSRNTSLQLNGVIVCNTLEQLLETISGYNTDDVFVIGGQAIYALLIDYCAKAYVTHIDAQKQADVFFPDIKSMSNWIEMQRSEQKEYNDISFVYTEYENTNVKN